MSDDKKKPKIPPPDDYSKTTPNIDFDDDSDWTPSDNVKDAPDDDWGKTVINYNVHEEHDEKLSFGEQQHPSPQAKEVEWGMTQTNLNEGDEFGDGFTPVEEDADGKTVPYFRLPEVDQKKYQNIPPTPTEQAEKAEKENKGGIPLWFWASFAIMLFLAFSIIVSALVWFFFIRSSGMEVVITGAKPGTRFLVDNGSWGIGSTGNKFILANLKPGPRTIQVVNPKYDCTPNPFTVNGVPGQTIPKTVLCRLKASDNKCANSTDVAERAKCAENALDNLGNPPDLDALLDALNLLIINFQTGSSNIPQDKQRILKKAAEKINQLPERVVIEVGGHTDNVGTDQNNQGLSERRGKAVRDALVGFGVRESALTTKGYGEKQPIADNSTEQGRFKNRRIQYTAVKR